MVMNIQHRINLSLHKKGSQRFTFLLVLIYFALAVLFPLEADALTPKEQYYKAKNQYAKLLDNATHQKRRDKWLACIDSFEAVYRLDPNGPWAAAGMFRSAELYYELYKRSKRTSYRSEALDTFERVIKRYPKSQYRKRSEAAIAAIQSKAGTGKVSNPKAKQAREKYRQAETCYAKLSTSPKKQKYRDQWMSCIEKYDAVHRIAPDSEYAAAGLYWSGVLHHGLYKKSFLKKDKDKAVGVLQNTIIRYPGSVYAQKAKAKILAISGRQSLPQTAKKKPATGLYHNQSDDIAGLIQEKKSAKPKASSGTQPANGKNTVVQGLRFWSNPSYTRIVIDADQEARFNDHILKQDPSKKKPPRLYVDLMGSVLKSGIETFVPINDNLLSNVRAGQHLPDSVRVVIDIKSYDRYKIFSLRNPFRIVIDVWGESVASRKHKRSPVSPGAKDEKLVPGALAKQLALGVRRIVIDPGHGGKDYGAPGYHKGVHEKKIVLAISRRLAKKIKKELSCEVILTRNSDRYLSLEERTAIANTKDADLFISIHTNSAKDRRAYGIETYFLNLATDDEAIRVAAIENQTSTKNISDLETILNDLMQNAKISESKRLATSVQGALNTHMRRSYKRVKNKGVKQAPFYVLLGAQMPAILVETSFISNPRECKRLTDPQYQEQLCNGIIKGIKQYIKDINPTALLRNRAVAENNG